MGKPSQKPRKDSNRLNFPQKIKLCARVSHRLKFRQIQTLFSVCLFHNYKTAQSSVCYFSGVLPAVKVIFQLLCQVTHRILGPRKLYNNSFLAKSLTFLLKTLAKKITLNLQ